MDRMPLVPGVYPLDAASTAIERAPTEPPRVSFISSYGGLGGSEIYLERLLSNIERSLVHSVILLGAGPLVDRIRRLSIATTVVPTSGRTSSFILASWKVRSILRRALPDVVHASGIKAAMFQSWPQGDWTTRCVGSARLQHGGVASAAANVVRPFLRKRR
jgi:hypothetical protein